MVSDGELYFSAYYVVWLVLYPCVSVQTYISICYLPVCLHCVVCYACVSLFVVTESVVASSGVAVARSYV